MDKIRFFLKIFGFTFLIAGVGLVIFSSKDKLPKSLPKSIPFAKIPSTDIVSDFSVAGVLGASTKKAEAVSSAIASDIGGGFETIKKQVLNIRVSDVISFVSRVQKIPQDARKVGDSVKEQVDNVVKSGKQ